MGIFFPGSTSAWMQATDAAYDLRPSGGSFGISAWCTVSSYASERVLISEWGPTSLHKAKQFKLSMNASGIMTFSYAAWDFTSVSVSSTTPLPNDGSWHHVYAKHWSDHSSFGNTSEIWIDGVQEGYVTGKPYVWVNPESPDVLRIGAMGDGSGTVVVNPWHGNIAEVGMWIASNWLNIDPPSGAQVTALFAGLSPNRMLEPRFYMPLYKVEDDYNYAGDRFGIVDDAAAVAYTMTKYGALTTSPHIKANAPFLQPV